MYIQLCGSRAFLAEEMPPGEKKCKVETVTLDKLHEIAKQSQHFESLLSLFGPLALYEEAKMVRCNCTTDFCPIGSDQEGLVCLICTYESRHVILIQLNLGTAYLSVSRKKYVTWTSL